jgi:hypothetical protein
MTMQLRVVAGDAKDNGKAFALPDAGTVDVGRGWTTLTQLHDLTVSRHHFRLTLVGGQIHLIDIPAEQGKEKAATLVNGRPVTRVVLADGDRIRMGRTELLLEDDAPPTVGIPLQGLPVTCSHCRKELRFRAHLGGTQVPCPHCGHPIVLPGPGLLESMRMTMRGLWLRALHNPEVPPAPAGTGLLKRIAAVLAILCLGVILGGIGYALLKQSAAGPPRAPVSEPGKEAAPRKD